MSPTLELQVVNISPSYRPPTKHVTVYTLSIISALKEKAAINQQKIVCPFDNTLLLVCAASESKLFVEHFQVEHDQLPEKSFELRPLE